MQSKLFWVFLLEMLGCHAAIVADSALFYSLRSTIPGIPGLSTGLRNRIVSFANSNTQLTVRDVAVQRVDALNGTIPSLTAAGNNTINPIFDINVPNVIISVGSQAMMRARDNNMFHNITQLLGDLGWFNVVPKSIRKLSSDKEGNIRLYPFITQATSLVCSRQTLATWAAQGNNLDLTSWSGWLDLIRVSKQNNMRAMLILAASDFASALYIRMHGVAEFERFANGDEPFTSEKVKSWTALLEQLQSADAILADGAITGITNVLSGKAACVFTMTGILAFLGFPTTAFQIFPMPAIPGGSLECANTNPLACPLETTVLTIFAALPKNALNNFGPTFLTQMYSETRAYLSQISPSTTFFEYLLNGPGYSVKSSEIPSTAAGLAFLRHDLDSLEKFDTLIPEFTYIGNPLLLEKFAQVITNPIFILSPGKNNTEPIDLLSNLESLEAERLSKILKQTAPVNPSQPPGIYHRDHVTVSLTSASLGAVVFYTLDETTPRLGTALPYSAPITISKRGTTTIRVIAQADGLLPSEERAYQYTIEKIDVVLIIEIVVPVGVALIIALIVGVVIFAKNKDKSRDLLISPLDIEFGSIIGVGARGVVFKGTFKGSTEVAIKTFMSEADMRLALKDSEFTMSQATLKTGSLRTTSATTAGSPLTKSKSMKKYGIDGASSATTTTEQGRSLATSYAASLGSDNSNNNNNTTSATKKSTKVTFRKVFTRELQIISRLRHPHIVLTYGFYEDRKARRSGIVLEYMEQGSLFDLLGNPAYNIFWRKRLEYAIDIAKGMQFMASMSPPLIHRDLKSLNILVDSTGRAKISDFDLATTSPSSASPTLGSVPWSAPEIIKSNGASHSLASDVYALGVILWEIATRAEPYAGMSLDEISGRVTSGGRPDTSLLPADTPKDYIALIKECWSQDSSDRPGIKQVLQRLLTMLPDAPGEAMERSGHSLRFATQILGAPKVKDMQTAMLNNGRVSAETLGDESVVLFSDIVGYTNLSTDLSPVEVAEFLGTLFGKFDSILASLGGFKYKTIGDAYLAVFPPNSGKTNPAALACRVALSMVNAAAGVKTHLGPTLIRVGLHQGPIAVQMISLDTIELLGDTVNIAARMEQLSEKGKIMTTEKVKIATGDKFAWSSGRNVAVKGKGTIETFFCLSEREMDINKLSSQPALLPGSTK